ncbi:Desulfoferrodoxin [Lawsonia intracellularis PHE/MN1-00]|uniref:Desulfoferrodoxin n=2 Tax=Lawsonia intracellularis TaxID=29546 RepID=Q1MRP7_LAWIP|nr:Desulfoferrodoxin [Lawsonia intracellularis PHE/MN1-00]
MLTEKNAMSKQFEIYKCEKCGNIVELLFASSGTLSCCGQPMTLMNDSNTSGAKEKHVPIIENNGSGCKVTVSTVIHPMEEKHWIEWIEIVTIDGHHCKKFLNPGDEPIAYFNYPLEQIAYAREYCNLHGLWEVSVN